MAGDARFHNKYHRRNHHSLPSANYPDSGSDPIASPEEPFQGDFHVIGSISATNNLTIGGDALIYGNLSALGELTFLDTLVSITSSLSVVNRGTGYAVTVVQEGEQPVAIFYDDRRPILKLNDNLSVEYFNCSSTQPYTISQGYATLAASSGAHTEGFYSIVSGNFAHAEGYYTNALGDYSHSQGISTSAVGTGSFASGNLSLARGKNSIVLGALGNAMHDNSVVISTNTNVFNSSSFEDCTFNVFASGGNYLLNQTTIGNKDLQSQFIVTSAGLVGINVFGNPTESLHVKDGNLWVENGAISATGLNGNNGLIYSREFVFDSLERPSLTGLKEAVRDLLYVYPAVTNLQLNSYSNGSSNLIFEVGQQLSTPQLSWTSNKAEQIAINSYIITLPNGNSTGGPYTFNFFQDVNNYDINTLPGTNTQEISTWSVYTQDWKGNSDTDSISVIWRFRVYYGVTNSPNPNNSDIINGTTSSVLANSRLGLGSRTVSPVGQYFFVAYPFRFGSTSLLRVNGLGYNDFTVSTLNPFVNNSGGSDSYTVLRSNNLLTSNYSIEII